jgi:hypothetical protein
VILLADLVFRSRVLVPMYTDSGVLGREALREFVAAADGQGLYQWGTGTWSLHMAFGEPGPILALFVIAGIFAILLALGQWTRLATIASFALLVSLHNRNPFTLTSGDTMLRVVMFWAMFLPLGKIWSLDAWRARRRGAAPPESTRYASAATAGLVFQVFILYFFTGLAKWNELWWDGNAMYVVLNLSIYAREFGRELRNWPALHQFVSVATVATEVFFPPLLLIGYRNAWWRWLNLVTFCGLHIAVLLSMSIGLFSFICCAIWLALIPGSFWDFLRIPAPRSGPEAPSTLGVAPNPLARCARVVANYFCVAMIVFMLVWNVLNIFPRWVSYETERLVDGVPQKQVIQRSNPLLSAYEWCGQALGVGQFFQMFGTPYRDDPWFIYRAKLVNGATVDIFNGGRNIGPHDPPKGISAMPIFHWRKLHHDLVDNAAWGIRQRLLDYQIEQWNRNHSPEEQVASAVLERYLDKIWPVAVLGEQRGAVVWGKYPKDAVPSTAFDQLYDRVIGEGENPGF